MVLSGLRLVVDAGAAVGAGVSSILMFLTLKKLRDLKRKAEKDEETEI